MLQSGKAIRRLSHKRCNVKYEMDGDVPDETLPPETDETASEEPVQPEGDASVDVQAASQIIASETTTSYSYIYASGKLLQEKVTTDGTTETHNFFYDNTGKPYAMQINGTTYYYVTNLQGDVMGLVDTSGNSVASYTYDPYGKVLTATGTLAEKNPLRYRGYYYDSESSLYYLQSRYYDPATRRFINADSYAGTGQGMLGYNMFAYCNNNPLLKLDSEGNLGLAVIAGGLIGGAIAGALIGTVSHLVSSGMKGEQVTAGGILSAAAVGAATGAIGALGGITGTSTVAAIVVGLVSGVTVAINTEGDFGTKFLTGFMSGTIAGIGTYLGSNVTTALDSGFVCGCSTFAGGLFSGAPTEIVSVAAQQASSKVGENIHSATNPNRSSHFPKGSKQFTEFCLY